LREGSEYNGYFGVDEEDDALSHPFSPLWPCPTLHTKEKGNPSLGGYS